MMCEQTGTKHLVRDVALAEEAGFDFAVISDHYFPWLEAQGHSPYDLVERQEAVAVIGLAAQAVRRRGEDLVPPGPQELVLDVCPRESGV
jgi:alkanesulfonate monooxygenase SsuD/methylene tetrahydromethanopterin reductase-like flavin-dependent oxidoreductase (luciferase family)